MDVLTAEFLGKPALLWLGFMTLVGGLLWLDLGVLNKKDHVIGPKESFLQKPFDSTRLIAALSSVATLPTS